MTIEGGCRCAAVRYTLALDAPPRVYACHCHQCQRWSGSAFSMQMLVPEAALTVTGPVAHYARTTEDRISYQRLCGECHARIYNTNTRRPGIAVIRAGTLDDTAHLVCAAHIFTDDRQRWFALPEGVPAYPQWAPPEALIAALRGGSGAR